MNTPVSFPLAKLLKKKGFDGATSTHYWLEDELNPEVIYSKTPRQGFFKEYGGSLSAPTISEAVMWLYEKHGIWITVGVDSLFHKGKHNTLIYKNHGNGLELISIENTLHGPYNLPTEAYEAAIEYTLNNLI